MKTKILLAELEQYILVVLPELKELRPTDYEYFHLLFPLLIPNLNSELTKDVRTKVYIHRDEIALEILKHALQNKEFLVFIEGVFSARHYKEANPEFFPSDKPRKEENTTPKIVNDSDPSLIQMAKNFGSAMVVSAKTGFKKITPVQHAERMAVCNTCAFWDGKARMGMGKCAKCGCTGAKQWLASSTCPINLWGSIT